MIKASIMSLDNARRVGHFQLKSIMVFFLTVQQAKIDINFTCMPDIATGDAECHCTAKHVDKDHAHANHKEAPRKKKGDGNENEEAPSKGSTSPGNLSDGDRMGKYSAEGRKVSLFRKRRRHKEPVAEIPEEAEMVRATLPFITAEHREIILAVRRLAF